jgi:hypothetical protein
MTTKTISSLALLKANWDKQHRDYIENFVPFIVTLISKKNYISIEVNTICKDFEEEFGLCIPYHPMITILLRVEKRGYIKKQQGLFIPVRELVIADDFTDIALEQERKYTKIIVSFVDFCQVKYRQQVSDQEADEAFISFLKEHDLEVLFATIDKSTLLPEADTSAINKFLINSFVRQAHEHDPEIFDFIVGISIGHIIATTLLDRNYDKYQGNLSGNMYLDTGLLFCLMGLDGDEKKTSLHRFRAIAYIM